MAKLRKWISKEANGYIFIWYHADNEEPWELPVLDFSNQKIRYSYEVKIYGHIQEFSENGADQGLKNFSILILISELIRKLINYSHFFLLKRAFGDCPYLVNTLRHKISRRISLKNSHSISFEYVRFKSGVDQLILINSSTDGRQIQRISTNVQLTQNFQCFFSENSKFFP